MKIEHIISKYILKIPGRVFKKIIRPRIEKQLKDPKQMEKVRAVKNDFTDRYKPEKGHYRFDYTKEVRLLNRIGYLLFLEREHKDISKSDIYRLSSYLITGQVYQYIKRDTRLEAYKDDLFQAANVGFVKAMDSFDFDKGKGLFSSWAFIEIKRTVCEEISRIKKDWKKEASYSCASFKEENGIDLDFLENRQHTAPYEKEEARWLCEIIISGIEKLDRIERQVFYLYCRDGLTDRQICEILDAENVHVIKTYKRETIVPAIKSRLEKEFPGKQVTFKGLKKLQSSTFFSNYLKINHKGR